MPFGRRVTQIHALAGGTTSARGGDAEPCLFVESPFESEARLTLSIRLTTLRTPIQETF